MRTHSAGRVREALFRRAGFPPNYAGKYPWLFPLLQAYHFLEAGIALDLAQDGRKPACFAGCEHCCIQPIPVTPPEIAGLELYVALHPEPARGSHWHPGACPFLAQGVCSVYPVRPIACRRFLVFNKVCCLGETPTNTRPADVLQPSRVVLLDCLRLTLPYYEILGMAPEGPAGLEFFAGHTSLVQQRKGLGSVSL